MAALGVAVMDGLGLLGQSAVNWCSLPKFPQFVFPFPQLAWPDLSAIYKKDVPDQERVGRQEGRGHAGTVRPGC